MRQAVKAWSRLAYKEHEDKPTDFQSTMEGNAMHCSNSPVYSASEKMVLGKLAKADLGASRPSVHT